MHPVMVLFWMKMGLKMENECVLLFLHILSVLNPASEFAPQWSGFWPQSLSALRVPLSWWSPYSIFQDVAFPDDFLYAVHFLFFLGCGFISLCIFTHWKVHRLMLVLNQYDCFFCRLFIIINYYLYWGCHQFAKSIYTGRFINPFSHI